MDDNYIWYMDDGTVIEGKEALTYIRNRQKKLDQLIEKTDVLIEEMKKFNTSDTVIGDEEATDDVSKLMETLENLSVMEILCESLLKKLGKELHDD